MKVHMAGDQELWDSSTDGYYNPYWGNTKAVVCGNQRTGVVVSDKMHEVTCFKCVSLWLCDKGYSK